jgi:transposase
MDLTDAQWHLLEPILQIPKRRIVARGRPRRHARGILDGILWILRTGAPWRDLPRRYPPRSTCHARFQQWVRDGTLRKLFDGLVLRLHRRRELDHQESFIDGTYVPAKRGGGSVGKCRAGNATKVMALADGQGLPLTVIIADGSRHDVALVDRTLDQLDRRLLSCRLIADRAFDSAPLQQRLLDERGVELIAPARRTSRSRRPDRRKLRRYRRRWKVERLFAWLKRFRRLAIRYERKADNFLGFLRLGCVVVLTRRFPDRL